VSMRNSSRLSREVLTQIGQMTVNYIMLDELLTRGVVAFKFPERKLPIDPLDAGSLKDEVQKIAARWTVSDRVDYLTQFFTEHGEECGVDAASCAQILDNVTNVAVRRNSIVHGFIVESEGECPFEIRNLKRSVTTSLSLGTLMELNYHMNIALGSLRALLVATWKERDAIGRDGSPGE